MRNARSAALEMPSFVISGRWVMEPGESGCPSATPAMVTRRWRRSAARSAALTTMAAPPSLSRLQSSSRNGSEIMRELRWSSSVIGFFITALSFSSACCRQATATSPNCSVVVPYNSMCRRAIGAYSWAGAAAPSVYSNSVT